MDLPKIFVQDCFSVRTDLEGCLAVRTDQPNTKRRWRIPAPDSPVSAKSERLSPLAAGDTAPLVTADAEEEKETADDRRQDGNELFALGQVRAALACYRAGVLLSDDADEKVRAACSAASPGQVEFLRE